MFLLITLTITLTQISKIYSSYDMWYQCAKLYRPQNYLDKLPQLGMPYVPKVPVPNNQDRIFENNINNHQIFENVKKIQPTPTTTKVISVKTKYIYKNPICVKYSKKKKYCAPESVKKRQNTDKIVTKEVFFREGGAFRMTNGKTNMADVDGQILDFQGHGFSLMPREYNEEKEENLEGSMEPRLSTVPHHSKTPQLSPNQINELLIEDRLDQLETILPDYTRKRNYQTSTIYVTKVISNKRNMATLMVQNCIPQGYQLCPQKTKKRKSKIARFSDSEEGGENYYG